MPKPPNSDRIGVIVGIILTAAGVIAIFLPEFISMDMMSGGYALRFIGIFIALCGLVVWWVYGRRAAAFERIFAGQGLLAHWEYEPEQAAQRAREELEERRQQNRTTFLIIVAFMVVLGIPILAIPILKDPDTVGLVILGIYVGIIPLLGFVAYITPRLAYRRALRAGGQAYIAADGVFYQGALHTWKQPFFELKRVTFERDEDPPLLRFRIRYLTRTGVVHYATETLDVPVPSGQETRAEEIAQFFAGRSASPRA